MDRSKKIVGSVSTEKSRSLVLFGVGGCSHTSHFSFHYQSLSLNQIYRSGNLVSAKPAFFCHCLVFVKLDQFRDGLNYHPVDQIFHQPGVKKCFWSVTIDRYLLLIKRMNRLRQGLQQSLERLLHAQITQLTFLCLLNQEILFYLYLNFSTILSCLKVSFANLILNNNKYLFP